MSPALVVFVRFPAPGWGGRQRLMAWAAAPRLRGLKNRGGDTVRPHGQAGESSRAGGSNVNSQRWILPHDLVVKGACRS